jgi:hypothetical protein
LYVLLRPYLPGISSGVEVAVYKKDTYETFKKVLAGINPHHPPPPIYLHPMAIHPIPLDISTNQYGSFRPNEAENNYSGATPSSLSSHYRSPHITFCSLRGV